MSARVGGGRISVSCKEPIASGWTLNVEFVELFGKDLWNLLPTALSHEQLTWQRRPAALAPGGEPGRLCHFGTSL